MRPIVLRSTKPTQFGTVPLLDATEDASARELLNRLQKKSGVDAQPGSLERFEDGSRRLALDELSRDGEKCSGYRRLGARVGIAEHNRRLRSQAYRDSRRQPVCRVHHDLGRRRIEGRRLSLSCSDHAANALESFGSRSPGESLLIERQM